MHTRIVNSRSDTSPALLWALIGLVTLLSLIIGMTVGSAPGIAIAALALLLIAGVQLRHSLTMPAYVTRRVVVAMLVIAAGITAIRVLALSSNPEPFFLDESWELGYFVSFVQDGHLSDLTMERSTGKPEYSESWYLALPALWMALTNTSYWNLRLFQFVVINGALMGFVFLAARNWFDQRTAWLSVAVLFVSTIALSNTVIRHDGAVEVAIAASVWLHTEALKRERRWLHGLAGFVSGAAILFHLHGLVFAPATLVGLYGPHLLAARPGQRRRYIIAAVAFGVGILAAFAVHYLFQYAPDPENYVKFLNTRSMPGFQPIEIVRRTLQHLVMMMSFSVVEFYLVLVGLIACVVRRRFADLKLLAWFGMMYLALGAAQHEIFTNYVRQMMPLFALVIGTLLSFGLQRRAGGMRRPFVTRDLAAIAAALGLMLSVNFGPSLKHVLAGKPLHLPPSPAAAWVREHLPPDVKILSPSQNYLWLTEYEFTSTYYLWTSQRQTIGGSAVADVGRMRIANEAGPAIWDEVDADVVIYDNIDTEIAMLPDSLFKGDYLASRGYVLAYEWAGEWSDKPYEARVYVRDADKLLTASAEP